MAEVNYAAVTEVSGEEISQEQLTRLNTRYYWAGKYCQNKDVIEVACGTGPGLGYLQSLSKTLKAGDIAPDLIHLAQNHYGSRVDLKVVDAHQMPYADHSADVMILFEAIYYIKNIQQFINEVKRVLRPNGVLLITTANKDLYDFNPSPYSVEYFGVRDLNQLLNHAGFECEFWGEMRVDALPLKQRILRPIKKMVVKLNLLPKTMQGKKWLKKIVFGALIPMPAELEVHTNTMINDLQKISSQTADSAHKVIYCKARLN